MMAKPGQETDVVGRASVSQNREERVETCR